MPMRLALMLLALVMLLTILPPVQPALATLRYGSLNALMPTRSAPPQLSEFPSACGIGRTTPMGMSASPTRVWLPLVATAATAHAVQHDAPDPDEVAHVAQSITRPLQSAPGPGALAPLTQMGTAPRDFAEAVAFLYTGGNRVQTGVQPGVIDAARIAVVRGLVSDAAGAPLAGVKVAVFDRPEFGATITRADGRYDLVVNGGERLQICFDRQGYLPVQRPVTAPLRDYRTLDTVALLPFDPVVTTVDLNANRAIQAVRGSPVRDDDGQRQATLFFPQGTTVELVFPDGRIENISTLNVRASEYTVGANGPAAMPGALPAASGYTYAVEFSVDEALTAGAIDVRFSQPVINYLENFLDFPVGMAVPAGSYDRTLGLWIPEPNGRVVQVLRITNGFAVLDVDGSGQPASTAALAELGISEAELAQVAALYQPGQSLWRVPVVHFTPWDCNWPYGPPPDARPRNGPPPREQTPQEQDCEESGRSTIFCHNQTLGETVNVVGTPFSLNYYSGRMAGHTAPQTIQIPLTEADLPPSLSAVELELEVAGTRFTQRFAPEPNLLFSYAWDGLDAYGRPVRGWQPITIRIGYSYPGVYYAPADFANAFAAFGTTPLARNPTRGEITSWQEWTGRIRGLALDPRDEGLGGWTLNHHHRYDPESRLLLFGDGTNYDLSQRANGNFRIMAGNGELRDRPPTDNGSPATTVPLAVQGVDFGPDGRLYLVDSVSLFSITNSFSIRRVESNGQIAQVAGEGDCRRLDLPCGDGGPATTAGLGRIDAIAFGPDAALYLVEQLTPFADRPGNRIRRIGPDGTITTVAGNGTLGRADDIVNGSLATETSLPAITPKSLALGSDGSIYFASNIESRIFQVTPNGLLSSFAGNGRSCFERDGQQCGDGGRASEARLGGLGSLTVTSDGSVYIIHGQHIRRITPDGLIDTVFRGDSQLFGDLLRLRTLPHDSILLLGSRSPYIWRLTPDGILLERNGVLVGFEALFPEQELRSVAYRITDLAVGWRGEIYAATGGITPRYVIQSFDNATIAQQFTIPSPDGSTIYHFATDGSHLRTQDTLTGATRYSFAYDAAGRLTSVSDGDGNTTTIEHDNNGNPTTIIGPYGARTNLGVDANGYLNSITDPANNRFRATYDGTGGLLTSFGKPLDQTSRMTYDALGRLSSSTDATGQIWRMSRDEGFTGATLTITRGERTTSYLRTHPNRNRVSLQNTFTDGTSGTRSFAGPDNVSTTYRFGSTSVVEAGADPQWGTQAPLAASVELRSPGGVVTQRTQTREIVLVPDGARNDPLSLVTITDTLRIDGREAISVYDAATRTLQVTSPAGRRALQRVDAQGRVTRTELPGLAPELRSYDERGRLDAITFGDTTTRSLRFAYNPAGELANITDALGRTWQLRYDQAGRLSDLTRPDGQRIEYRFDALGNLTSLTPPGRPAQNFSYSPVNLLQSMTLPSVGAGPVVTTYTYNANRQRTGVTRPDGSQVRYDYSASGQVIAVTAANRTTNYNYSNGTLATATTPDATLTYRYDGHLTTEARWSGGISGSVQYSYGTGMRLNQLRINNANPINLVFDADGLITRAGALELNYAAGEAFVTASTLEQINDQLAYDPYGELASYRARVGSNEIISFSYTRDAVGRITSLRETIGGQTTTYAYSYDLLGRLTAVQRNGTNSANYSYDPHGNRLRVIEPSGTTNATYDAQDRLLSYGATSFSYNAAGDLLSRTSGGQTTSYTYDPLGNLLGVTLPDGRVLSYLIDGENRRVGKRVDGVLQRGWLYYDDLRPLAELDGNNNVVSRFIYADGAGAPSYMVRDGVTYRIIRDHLGSPRLVVNATTGALAQRLDYDAFGRVLNDTNPGFQPFGFAGGLYDPDTGLVRFGSRDYDPSVGRWTTRDPGLFRGGDSNAYAYVNNDPVNFRDPSGEFIPLAAAAALAWAAAELGMSIADLLDFINALFDPCVSDGELAVDAIGLLLSILGPGGGYNRLAKWLDEVRDLTKISDKIKHRPVPKTTDGIRRTLSDIGGDPNRSPRVAYPPGGASNKPSPYNNASRAPDRIY